MKNIRIIIVAIIGCFITLTCFSQIDNQEWEELHNKILKQKYEFLQKELVLDNEQMDKFWKVYLQYDNEITQCHQHSWKSQCQLTKCSPQKHERVEEDKLEDNVATQLIEERLKTEKRLLEIDEMYTHRFKEVLPIQKVLKLNRLEKKFMREVMTQNERENSRECHINNKSFDKKAKRLNEQNKKINK